MVNRPALARFALFLVVFTLLIAPGSATSTIMSEGGFPEMIPDDPTLEYVWNIPLKLILLDFVFMTAPLLFLPVNFISVTVWLILGKRRISRRTPRTRNPPCGVSASGKSGSTMLPLPHAGINVGTLRTILRSSARRGRGIGEQPRRHTIRAAREQESAYPLNEMRKRMFGL